MSPGHDLPSARRRTARRAGSQPLTAADTERLLTGHGARPEVAPTHYLLAGLLDSAAGPASDQELAGEVAAVAAFVLVSDGRAPRSAWFRGAGAAGRRGPVIAAGIAAAFVVGLSGAAAADALPAPIQELAHKTFGAPAPRHSGPLPRATVSSGSPTPVTSPALKSPAGKATAKGNASANANGNANGKAKASAKPSPNGLTHGKKNGKTAPPGHQKP